MPPPTSKPVKPRKAMWRRLLSFALLLPNVLEALEKEVFYIGVWTPEDTYCSTPGIPLETLVCSDKIPDNPGSHKSVLTRN